MFLDGLPMLDLPAPLAWVVLGWLFAVGACIGSFMNVVIYRLPAGMSLLHPGSRCPACETPIRATDNVPIFGWIWLGGRCRQCRAAISGRYPAVELMTALLFAGLAVVELYSGGLNLPLGGSRLSIGLICGLYGYHLFLVCSLVCAAFIEADGHALPVRLAVAPIIVGFGAPLVWPHLRPLAVVDSNAALDGLIGLASGAVLGLAVWSTALIARRHGALFRAKARDFAIVLAWIGTFLGWQAASALAVAATVTRFFLLLVSRVFPALGRVGPVGCVALWTIAWIVAWRLIVERLPWLGAGANIGTWLVALAGVALLAPITATITPSEKSPRLTGSQRRT